MNELEMFRRGMDTHQIAYELKQSEALTYNRIARLREAERMAMNAPHLQASIIAANDAKRNRGVVKYAGAPAGAVRKEWDR